MSPQKMSDFEKKLSQLRPAAPGPQVSRRIEKDLKLALRKKRLAKIRSSAGWAGMAIAASVLITFGFLLFNGQINLQEDLIEPVALTLDPEPETLDSVARSKPFNQVLTENNLQSRIDEGIVFLQNGMTARRYRYQFVDRVVWQNPTDGATVELEVPRDEIVLIPVQTF